MGVAFKSKEDARMRMLLFVLDADGRVPCWKQNAVTQLLYVLLFKEPSILK